VNPRFVGEAGASNLKFVANLESIADEKHVSVAQLALAWVLSRGADVVPIPGTKRRKWLLENIAASDIVLSESDLAAISAAVPREAVQGKRYAERAMDSLNG
jgi:aryl-alcohol dehydrogenase-like predicted oxidoreductase